MNPSPVVLGRLKIEWEHLVPLNVRCLVNLLEVAKEISKQNVESPNKLFLAVNDKVLQEEIARERTIPFASKI